MDLVACLHVINERILLLILLLFVLILLLRIMFFFSSRRRHTRSLRDWSSDVCSSDLRFVGAGRPRPPEPTAAWRGHRRTSPRTGQWPPRRLRPPPGRRVASCRPCPRRSDRKSVV